MSNGGDFLNRLKQLREEKGLYQSDLAKLINKQSSLISKLETERVPLTDDYIRIFCNYFDVTSDYLLGISDIRNGDMQIAATGERNGVSEEEIKLLDDFLERLKKKM
jgi:transcriptional regulator with XRE-family HTH domain